MLVGKRMNPDPVTIHPSASVEDALYLMREKGLRHLPVLDMEDRLVGMVSERDLLLVSPSPISSLSVQEMMFELSRLRIGEIMAQDFPTVDVGNTLEEAAALMIDHKVSALPVVSEGRLAGIITETDVFRIFLEVLDVQVPGVRLTMLIPDEKGVIAYLCGRIAGLGGNILSLGEFRGREPGTRTLAIKVADVPEDELLRMADEARQKGCQLLDARSGSRSLYTIHSE